MQWQWKTEAVPSVLAFAFAAFMLSMALKIAAPVPEPSLHKPPAPMLAAQTFKLYSPRGPEVWRDSNVHVLTIHADGPFRVRPWVGEPRRNKCRAMKSLSRIVEENHAAAAVSASFFWAQPFPGAMVLGHVAIDGESFCSPNTDVLRRRRCYFAVRQDGTFEVGETSATTGQLLHDRPEVRHLVGGGGWLVRNGEANAWRLAATQQEFKSDVTRWRKRRCVVAVNESGKVCRLMLFDGEVTLREAARFAQQLGAHHALFFDGGHTAEMTAGSIRAQSPTSRPRPVPVALLVTQP